MSVTMSVVLVVAFSFAAGEGLRWLAHRRGVILSGVEYAVIGVLLGPLGAGMLTEQVLTVMEPAVWLMIGLVGFTMGLRLQDLLTASASRATAGVLLGAASLVTVGAAGAGVLMYAQDVVDPSQLWLPILVFGAAGSVGGTRLHRSAVEALGARGPIIDTLRLASVTSSTLAVVVAGLMEDWQRATDSPALYESLHLPHQLWLAMGVLVGVACGVLFAWFQRGEANDERTFLATIGVVIFASGIAEALGSSPLLVGLVTGVTVSILSSQAGQLRTQLQLLDRPVSIALLLFAGALFVPLEGVYWLLPVVYAASRALSLFVWPRLLVQPLVRVPHAGRLGAGMRSQGVIAVAIGVSLDLAYPEHAVVTDAVLVGVLLFEVGASQSLRRLLGDAGELRRVSVEAEVAA
jgi:hypothetical protein